MSKIHPSSADQNRLSCQLDSSIRKLGGVIDGREDDNNDHHSQGRHVFTVWKRSSMSFQGTDGFTVFDEYGKLAFRVDNYTRRNKWYSNARVILLMDGSGNPLLTLKPQVLSMQYQWNGYIGGDDQRAAAAATTPQKSSSSSCNKKLFTMKRAPSGFRSASKSSSSSCQAHVFLEETKTKSSSSNTTGCKDEKSSRKLPDFRIEGSFKRRNCKIISSKGELVANIARKRVVNNTTSTTSTMVLSDDVFSLVVQPGFQPQLVMGFLIIMDRISSSCTYNSFITPTMLC